MVASDPVLVSGSDLKVYEMAATMDTVGLSCNSGLLPDLSRAVHQSPLWQKRFEGIGKAIPKLKQYAPAAIKSIVKVERIEKNAKLLTSSETAKVLQEVLAELPLCLSELGEEYLSVLEEKSVSLANETCKIVLKGTDGPIDADTLKLYTDLFATMVTVCPTS